MQSSRFQKLRRLFEQAITLDDADRRILLDEVREQDDDLVRRVEQLLVRDASSRRAIESGIKVLVRGYPEYRHALDQMRAGLAEARPNLEPEDVQTSPHEAAPESGGARGTRAAAPDREARDDA